MAEILPEHVEASPQRIVDGDGISLIGDTHGLAAYHAQPVRFYCVRWMRPSAPNSICQVRPFGRFHRCTQGVIRKLRRCRGDRCALREVKNYLGLSDPSALGAHQTGPLEYLCTTFWSRSNYIRKVYFWRRALRRS